MKEILTFFLIVAVAALIFYLIKVEIHLIDVKKLRKEYEKWLKDNA